MDVVSITQLRAQRVVAAEQRVPAQDALLEATLTVPPGARAVVVLPHASSAGRFDRNHCFTAEVLAQSGLGTLQIDLLTPSEEASFGAGSAPVALLAERMSAAIMWLRNQPDTRELALGLFVTEAESVAAMTAEAASAVGALVSKGGTTELFGRHGARFAGPTLLLLGAEELARAAELAAEFFAGNLR